uniref:Uncharacterized protein n=1 Tax=Aplanochytrium stocchinoi TaxID=215587 RepID=A0A6S8A2D2_9STRA|mmetsp:Transcript_14723/g.17209  ORF Transcript_14723/g.17209 Transcript_14723/m.17209 type:complete len:275 (+) Transcript_14723:1349-2173(+)
MGRVSRYKKEKSTIKNFGKLLNADSYNDAPVPNRKSRKRGRKLETVDGFEIEPDRGYKMIKKFNTQKKKGSKKSVPKLETLKASKDLSKNDKKSSSLKHLKIKSGESLRDFSNRVDKEARDIVHDQSHSQTSSAMRRKTFMKQRSKKRKLEKQLKRTGALKNWNESDDESELIYQGKKVKSKYKGKKDNNNNKNGSIITRRVGLHDVVDRPPGFTENSGKSRFKKMAFMRDDSDNGNKNTMELQKSGYAKIQMEQMRSRVIKAYQGLKKKGETI